MAVLTESPIVGIIVSSFTDAGPQVIFNSATIHISEDQALNLSIRIMTLIGEQVSNDIYGPLPVPSNKEYLCLAFVFRVASSHTTDPRLTERLSIICAIFKRALKRDMSRAQGLILSYLSKITSEDLKSEDDLTDEKMKEIHKRLSALITTNPVRIYRIENDTYVEHTGEFYIPSDAYIIADIQKQTLFMIFDSHLSPVRKLQVGILIDLLNENLYKRRFNKRIVDTEDEADRLSNFYGLKKKL